jgi:hypothetical protein
VFAAALCLFALCSAAPLEAQQQGDDRKAVSVLATLAAGRYDAPRREMPGARLTAAAIGIASGGHEGVLTLGRSSGEEVVTHRSPLPYAVWIVDAGYNRSLDLPVVPGGAVYLGPRVGALWRSYEDRRYNHPARRGMLGGAVGARVMLRESVGLQTEGRYAYLVGDLGGSAVAQLTVGGHVQMRVR